MELAVDAVVFAYKENNLFILLIKRKYKPFENYYALPGGFIHENETAEDAVKRELMEETGIEITYLEQLYTFTEPKRDPRNRVVSLTYYGLVNPDKFNLTIGNEATSVEWIPIKNVTDYPDHYAFDHGSIITYALTRLKNKIKYKPIGFELLPEKFTIGELYRLYTTILDQEIDRRNFYSKIEKFNLLIDTNEIDNSGSVGRKGKLYSFNEEKYNKLKISGFDFRFENL